MFLKTAEPGNNSYPNALPSKRQRGWFRRFDPRSFTRAAVAMPFPRFQRLPRHRRDTPSLTMVPYGRASWFALSGTAPASAARAVHRSTLRRFCATAGRLERRLLSSGAQTLIRHHEPLTGVSSCYALAGDATLSRCVFAWLPAHSRLFALPHPASPARP